MKLKIISFLVVLLTTTTFSQSDRAYKAERTKTLSLIHTKLKVDFNFANQTMDGEAWVTVSPYFYAQDKVVLDAKSMLIHSVMMANKSLEYTYDNTQLTINLPRSFKRSEEFTLYVKYTAQPEKVNQKGSQAITSAKGLYFINPTGLQKDKPTQIWTQGETEASSCWFPTIDAPNQKTSQEIYITVPNKYTTLSNGKLESQTEHTNGTRTDYWNFKQKHAPYLFFMGIGDYEIIEDRYNTIPVRYYVEKKIRTSC